METFHESGEEVTRKVLPMVQLIQFASIIEFFLDQSLE